MCRVAEDEGMSDRATLRKLSIVRGLAVGGWVAALVWWERRKALRRVVDSKLQRDARNLVIAAGAGAVMQFGELPVAFTLARRAKRTQSGLLQWIPMPPVVRSIVGILLLDYTLYVWHVLTHRVPLLWRFHQVHHVDREMDATTALRFHFGEIAISIAFRALQVWVIGPTPVTVALWQIFLLVCILFHHANVRLPIRWERWVARIVITPRLHGIHHSIASDELNSNWSSGLTVWDWLHGTLRTDVPQDDVVIGVAGMLSDAQQRLKTALTLLFQHAAVGIRPAMREFARESVAMLAE